MLSFKSRPRIGAPETQSHWPRRILLRSLRSTISACTCGLDKPSDRDKKLKVQAKCRQMSVAIVFLLCDFENLLHDSQKHAIKRVTQVPSE